MITSRLAPWLYTRPRVRRAWALLQLLWGGALLAVLTAPTAAAESIANTLAWTGLHDSDGIPVGAHIVSTVSMIEAAGSQGPSLAPNPSSWGPAAESGIGTAVTYFGLASVLAWESAVLAAMVAVAVWFIKFALSTVWLGWLAALARPILANIHTVVGLTWLLPGAFIICVAVGGVTAVTRGIGRGLGIILGGLLVAVAGWVLLRDPVGEVLGDNGILGIGRSLGFTVSQGVANNGPLAAGGTAGQLDRLTSWLVDVLVREQIEMINFGRVIDAAGCRGVYDAALLHQGSADPVHAVQGCSPDGFAYATQLGGSAAAMFAILILVEIVLLLAICYVAAEVIKVGFKAWWKLFVIVPAVAVAVAPGPHRQYAKRLAVRLCVHGAETIVATAGLGVMIILIAKVTRGSAAGLIGMDSPMAKLVVMFLLAVLGAVGFRALLHGFGDRGIPTPRQAFHSARGHMRATESAVKDAGRGYGYYRAARDVVTGRGKTRSGGGTGVVAAGRKAHPEPTGRRPRSTPSDTTQTRPAPSGPGRTGQPVGSSAAAAVLRSSETVGRRTADTTMVSATAKKMATVAAPEVAAAAVVADRVTRRVGRGGGQESAPKRTQARGDAPGRAGRAPQETSAKTAQNKPAQPSESGTTKQQPPAGPAAPGRSTPNPTDPR